MAGAIAIAMVVGLSSFVVRGWFYGLATVPKLPSTYYWTAFELSMLVGWLR